MRIGIDMGGTKIAGGLIDRGRIIRRITLPTGAAQGRKHVLRQLQSVIDGLSEGRRIESVGIGIPGTFKGTKLLVLPNIPCLDGIDIKAALRSTAALKAGVPLAIENDAKCFALAESRMGAAKGKRHVIGLIIGTGVGAGIIIEGKIYHGRGNAGEIGQIRMHDGTIWEDIISGPAIIKRHRARGGKERSVSEIWASSSPHAKRTRTETVELLTHFITSLMMVFDPDAIVLGGGVSNAPLVKPVNALLKKRGLRPVLVQNRLGVDGAILGAAAIDRR